MFRKKILTLSFLLLTVVLFATSCEVHEHIYNEDWKCNAFEHWQVCPEDGVKLEKDKHVLDEECICTVCGCEVISFGDEIYVSCYDKYDNIIERAEYNIDGSLITKTVFENEYDENGNIIKITTIEDGQLSMVEEYAVNADGESVIKTKIEYYTEEAYVVTEYDENGNFISVISYESKDVVFEEYYYEYLTDEDGNSYNSKVTIIKSGNTSVITYNENGDETSRVVFDENNDKLSDKSWKYIYDKDGNCLNRKYYNNDVLCEETEYAVSEEIDTDGEVSIVVYTTTVTTYSEDGTKNIITYNSRSDKTSDIVYDENNKKLSDEAWEYIYDEDGNWKNVKYYIDGMLCEETEYKTDKEYDEDGEYSSINYPVMITTYDADGTKTVITYNINFEKISKIVYDKDNNKLFDETFEYIHNENDDIICEKVYRNGVLYKETTYDYEEYTVTITVYNEDGTKTISKYDIWGELLSEETVAQ